MMDTHIAFTVFPFGAQEWCACRADGLVCGYFVNQACAIRFAQRECCGAGTITVRDDAAPDVHFLRAA
jgi:hypothetical protein